MAISKVVYSGRTLIDLTSDTVDASKLLSGTTAHAKDGTAVTGTCTYDADTSDGTADAAEVLATKTAYVNGAKVTGTMANNGAVSGSISSLDGDYTVPVGFHDGSGKVAIAEDEKGKIVAGNIKQGVTILGVVGTCSTAEDLDIESDKEVTPSTDDQTITPTEGKDYFSQVIVKAIPYTETSAGEGKGTCVTIG